MDTHYLHLCPCLYRPAAPPAPPDPSNWDATLVECSDTRCYKVQRSRPEVYELVSHVLEDDPRCPWREVTCPGWNLLWTWRKPRCRQRALLAWQMVNHYPNSCHLTRKDLMKKHLSQYARLPGRSGSAFAVIPRTYVLPSEYVAFADEFAGDRHRDAPSVWIMKPVGMSRGRGIELVTDIQDVTYGVNVVIQRFGPPAERRERGGTMRRGARGVEDAPPDESIMSKPLGVAGVQLGGGQ